MAAGDIGSNLRTYLLTVSAITDLLGTTTEVFADRLPQRGEYVLPAIVYNVISGRSLAHLGTSGSKGMTRVQVDCWAADRPAANALYESVRKNLEHYSGAAGDDTIDISLHTDPIYKYEEPKDASENGLFAASADYLIWHSLPAVST